MWQKNFKFVFQILAKFFSEKIILKQNIPFFYFYFLYFGEIRKINIGPFIDLV